MSVEREKGRPPGGGEGGAEGKECGTCMIARGKVSLLRYCYIT